MNNNVIVSCAVTGSGDTAKKHPNLPITPKQIADAAIEAVEEGSGAAGDGLESTDKVPSGGDSTKFTYSTTTTDSDPGSGYVRFNNGTLASATIAYIDDADADGICDYEDDCEGEYDCLGDCNGGAVIDDCGVCDGDNSGCLSHFVDVPSNSGVTQVVVIENIFASFLLRHKVLEIPHQLFYVLLQLHFFLAILEL